MRDERRLVRLSARKEEKEREEKRKGRLCRIDGSKVEARQQGGGTIASHSLSFVAGKRTLQLSYNTIRHELKHIKGDVIWYVFSRKMIGHQTKPPTHLLAQGH